jgi:hypothetical protein
MDGLDQDGNIEFGDFLRCVGTFCLFGKVEILKFLFVYADKEKEGHLLHEQFIQLVNTVNPYDKKLAKRSLKEVSLMPGTEMDFAEFSRLSDTFPSLFKSFFSFQNKLRTKFLGIEWWFVKMTKYKGVRKKLVSGTKNTDEVANVLIKRFKDDKIRDERMRQREKEIHLETSTVRKAILEARQFIDEIT